MSPDTDLGFVQPGESLDNLQNVLKKALNPNISYLVDGENSEPQLNQRENSVNHYSKQSAVFSADGSPALNTSGDHDVNAQISLIMADEQEDDPFALKF